MRTLVVAGNYAQYRQALGWDEVPRDSRYVYDVRDLYGYAETVQVRFIGTYWDRKDLAALRDIAQARGYELLEGP